MLLNENHLLAQGLGCAAAARVPRLRLAILRSRNAECPGPRNRISSSAPHRAYRHSSLILPSHCYPAIQLIAEPSQVQDVHRDSLLQFCSPHDVEWN